MALRLTVVYLLHVLPYVGLVRVFTRHCRSVISRWLVTTVTLLVAVRHQVTRPAVGVCCLCSGQQYSPPSPLQPALTSPPPPRIPFTAVDGGAGEDGCQPAPLTVSRACWIRWRFLRNETGHRFEKWVPVTPLPFYVSAVRYTIRILAPCCIVLQMSNKRQVANYFSFSRDWKCPARIDRKQSCENHTIFSYAIDAL